MKGFALSLMSAAVLLAGSAARADSLTVTLSSPFQNGVGASVLAFDATVTNDTSGTVYLVGDSPTINSPLTLDDSPYNNGFPVSLGAGDSYTGELFDVDIPTGTPVGLYAGDFEITGGSDPSDQDVVGSADFNVNVTPEPPSFVLLATGLMGGLVMLQLRRRGLLS